MIIKREVFYVCFIGCLCNLFCFSKSSCQNREPSTLPKSGFEKPPIEITDYDKWPLVGTPILSNNGKYALFTINNSPLKSTTLVLQSCWSKWKKIITNIVSNDIVITEDSRFAIFIGPNDSLGIIELGTDQIQYKPDVATFKIPEAGKGEWMAYQLKESSKELIVRNIRTGQQRSFDGVIEYLFNREGNILLIETEEKKDTKFGQVLQLFDLRTNKVITIWKGAKAHNFVFDDSGAQLVFCINEENNYEQDYGIYYYKAKMPVAIALVKNISCSIGQPGFIANRKLLFSNDGRKVFFYLNKILNAPLVKKQNLASVDIWNYKDKYLQSYQLSSFFSGDDLKTNFRAVIDINAKKIVPLEDQEVQLCSTGNNENYELVCKKAFPDYYYNNESRPSYYLISLNDGTRKKIKEKASLTNVCLSPDECFVIWFDIDSLNYFSYEIATRITREISHSIPYPIYDEDAFKIGRSQDFGIAGWVDKGDGLLIYDRFDIWKVDPRGMNPSVNLTNGYGRKHQIVFGILENEPQNNIGLSRSKQSLYLTGFDRKKKQNGFWKTNMSAQIDPELLIMGPHSYYIPVANNYVPRLGITGYIEYASAGQPVKAKDVNCWLVTRMNAKEAPNYFITTDFKSFKKISDIEPQMDYNWMTAELVTWKMTDGKWSQGILYKPENFDSTKKYPLIFTYYEKRSDEMNQFLKPDFSEDQLNIPTYVSNGYLVFVPDIEFTQGHNGQSVMNAVVSAAKYFSKFFWVDSTKLGLQGHSFAGWGTNYLITHSNLFAAACEASGVSDQVSGYGQLFFGIGISRQSLYEVSGQGSPYGIGVTPWTNPELYIENSPIFYINDITTPLLMMHGDEDKAVPFAQAIEMFLAMKRAGKKVWLLQYEKAGHSLSGENKKDYTIRMKQFFDYYLKGLNPPKWMVEGIPSKMKGIDNGLELDYSNRKP